MHLLWQCHNLGLGLKKTIFTGEGLRRNMLCLLLRESEIEQCGHGGSPRNRDMTAAVSGSC